MKRLFSALLLSLTALCAQGSGFVGDFAPGTAAICGTYTTYNPSTGAPFTLAGTPAISIYKIGDGTNSNTESTTGVTHVEDKDTRTGYNLWCVDPSADGTFYSAGAQFSVVITAGTVNSVSVANSEVGSFSLNKVAALRPTTAGRTLVVDSAGLADANTVKLGPSGSGTAQTARDIGASVLLSTGTGTGQLDFTSGRVKSDAVYFGGAAGTFASGRPEVNLGNTTAQCIPATGCSAQGTLSGTHSSTTADLGTNAPGATSDMVGKTLVIPAKYFARAITAYNTSTGVATFDTTSLTLADGDQWYLWETSPGSGGSLTTTDVENAVLNASLASHTTAGTAGERLGRVPNVAAGSSGGLPTVDANNAVKVQSGSGANQISLSSGQVVIATNNDKTGYSLTVTPPTAAQISAQVIADQRSLTGTCSSGSTTTCVDAARTEADASQLQDRLICFDDEWCALITTFNPGTDTVTTTKVAPTTRSSKAYTIFPSTAQ